MEKRPILISLTGPSCSGKTTILNSLQLMGITPIVSSTTRQPRVGEINGKDYFFISDLERQRVQAANGFVELVEFSGNWYGVTKSEMRNKLVDGSVCAIVLDPMGVKEYENICSDIGALIYKVYVDTDVNLRVARMQERFLKDLKSLAPHDTPDKLVSAYTSRLSSTLCKERLWYSTNNWEMNAFGDLNPNDQASTILRRALEKQRRDVEVRDFIFSKPHLHIGK